ncbi:unnamed protein product [Calypogeia fissa]
MNMNGQLDTVMWPRTPTGIRTSPQYTTTPVGPKTPGGAAASGIAQNDTPGRRLVQSPRLDLVNPNDDETERARIRAARAEQKRRSCKILQPPGTGQASASSQEDSNILSNEALSALLQNCLKLSNANKINQGNTWDLKLIDHLSDLVKTDVDENEQINFQLASCTLETGVKIYSYRVDSVHSEAHKLVGGLGRSANEQATTETPSENGAQQGANPSQGSKESAKKAGAILLASNDTINLKKIDVAFNVDPLFHQTSALFDDGAAQGLLLHNLSVYSGCEVIFDSFEVPELKMKAQAAQIKEGSLTVDLSFMKDTLERMMDVLRQEPEMTPTLKEIVKLFDDPRRAEFEAEGAKLGQSCQIPDPLTPARSWSDSADFDGPQDDDPGEIYNEVLGFDNMETGSFNGAASPDSRSWSDTNGELEDNDEGGDDSDEVFMSQDPLEWLAMSNGMPAKSNAWAGPDHWKYAHPKEDASGAHAQSEGKGKTKRKKKEPFSMAFEDTPEFDLSDYNPPKNPRSLLRPQSVIPKSYLLPEDCHFEATSLAKFTLRPSVWVFRRRLKRSERGTRAENVQDMSNEAIWGDDDDPSGGWEHEAGHSEVEDPMGADLVPEPRKVQKIAITYDKQAKQVDVRLLKGVLWEQVQHGAPVSNQEDDMFDKESGLSFQEVLQHFPEDCPAAAPEDISVHLCFICLLHLANEHCLRIDDCSTMDDLRIFFPQDGIEVEGT